MLSLAISCNDRFVAWLLEAKFGCNFLLYDADDSGEIDKEELR